MHSIWQQQVTFRQRDSLTRDLRTEVAVIGAGMTGILLADRLQQAGKEVVLLEAACTAGGQTAGTTAKVTAQHGLIYHELYARYGARKAALYAKAQRDAIDAYEKLIKDRHIDCDWQRRDAYVYALTSASLLEEEAKTAKKLGFDAAFTKETELPVPVAGAVRFADQAMFQPLAFLRALSEELVIYEHTPVLRVEENRIYTPHAVVQAAYIVFACHFPFVNFPGMYFSRMHQERSLVLALSGVRQLPRHMYVGADNSAYSLRPYREFLLFGGEGYRTGTNTGGRYAALEKAAGMWFPEAEIVAKWSAQDCIPARKIPYIGRFSQKHLSWFVATGYRKWGMTTAMAAAMLLTDMLCSKNTPLEELYTPDDFSLHEFRQILPDTCRSAASILSHAIPVIPKKASRLAAGEAAVTGQCHGTYRDTQLRLHTVSLRCPHLGCRLHFDPDDRTWECPCHGSRFDRHGRCIGGPAQKGISVE